MSDRAARALLLLIAVGVWLGVLTLWLRPAAVHDDLVMMELQAVHEDLETLNDQLQDLVGDDSVDDPADGTDKNPAASQLPSEHAGSVRRTGAISGYRH